MSTHTWGWSGAEFDPSRSGWSQRSSGPLGTPVHSMPLVCPVPQEAQRPHPPVFLPRPTPQRTFPCRSQLELDRGTGRLAGMQGPPSQAVGSALAQRGTQGRASGWGRPSPTWAGASPGDRAALGAEPHLWEGHELGCPTRPLVPRRTGPQPSSAPSPAEAGSQPSCAAKTSHSSWHQRPSWPHQQLLLKLTEAQIHQRPHAGTAEPGGAWLRLALCWPFLPPGAPARVPRSRLPQGALQSTPEAPGRSRGPPCPVSALWDQAEPPGLSNPRFQVPRPVAGQGVSAGGRLESCISAQAGAGLRGPSRAHCVAPSLWTAGANAPGQPSPERCRLPTCPRAGRPT